MGCRHYTDGPYCVAQCPLFVTYLSDNNLCQPCDPLCDGGCSGNGSHLGPGGCDGCHVILNINRIVSHPPIRLYIGTSLPIQRYSY